MLSFRRFFLVSGLGAFTLLCSVGGGLAYLFTAISIDLSILEQPRGAQPTIVLDDAGNEIMRFRKERSDPIAFSDLPPVLVHAFIATEDHAFFDHHGISWIGIARSLLVNLMRRRFVQGASTITQQLAKLVLLSPEKTILRKIREQLIALNIERLYSKEQILESYVNHAFFGAGIYGVQAASRRFWKKDVHELSVEEAATLAAILRSPSAYCPLYHPEKAVQRRNLVLGLMAKHGYLTSEECEAARAQPLLVHPYGTHRLAPHLIEHLRTILETKLGKDGLYAGGYTVHTTLNSRLQAHTEKAFRTHLTALRKRVAELDGAVVCIEPGTGAIKAVVGGFDFTASQFNRAFHARRQVGSLFKPLVYAHALNHGAELTDKIVDESLEHLFPEWNPRNHHRRFEGEVTLGYALVHSLNTVPIQLLLKHGIAECAALASKAHLPGPIPPYPSLALGCIDASPLEIAGLYTLIANDGLYVTPHLISCIKDPSGKKIERHTHTSERVLEQTVAQRIRSGLQAVVTHVQRRLPTLTLPSHAFGKTGTTNDARTCWFAGSTPTLTTVVCLGKDDNAPLTKKVYSTAHATPLWNEIMQGAPSSSGFKHLPQLSEVCIDGKTGTAVPFQDLNARAVRLLVSKKSP